MRSILVVVLERGLPDPIIEAITFHDSPSALPEEDYPSGFPANGFTPLVAVHVANYFCSDERESAYGCVEGDLDTPFIERLGYAEHIEAWVERCLEI
jgi:hypothetical protein